jgi:hypothetical protein
MAYFCLEINIEASSGLFQRVDDGAINRWGRLKCVERMSPGGEEVQ